MAFPGLLEASDRRVRAATVVAVTIVALFGIVLLPVFPASLRETVSPVGVLVAGLIATASVALRAKASEPGDRLRWLVLTAAGLMAIVGNLWSAATGADPVTSPSLVTNACIAACLVTLTAALAAFPIAKKRGAELLVMFLDGLVAGGALLVIVSKLVYSQIFGATNQVDGAEGLLNLAFPVLDVMLATVALLLFLRADAAQRLPLGLLAAGFWLYAAADLTFAARTAQGTFRFGSVLDLGWIYGYVAVGLAAWAPVRRLTGRRSQADNGLSDAGGATLVFGILLVAAVVQVGFGTDRNPQGIQAVAWILLVVAAGARQILLTADNAALRRGLERRVAEQTVDLRRLVRQNEVLLESVADGIYGVDPDGLLTFLNPSAARTLGYSLDELTGRMPSSIFATRPAAGAATLSSYVDDAINRGIVSSSIDDDYTRADGSMLPVEVTAAPLLDDNEVRGAVVVFRDVTQRREVDRIKNEFLSVVSHELRTPLTAIQGSLGLLEGGALGELPPRVASMIRVALDSSERLTRLISDLLDIERLESGASTLDLATIESGELLTVAAQQIEGMARASDIRVQVGSTAGRVVADQDQIVQTLINLIGNAVKFSQPGSVVRLESCQDGSMVRFDVRDHGRGIPKDMLEKVFERFEQVDSSDTRNHGGTGLGLAISHGIVKRHGGAIWAASTLGEGTTVSFTLPSALRSVPDVEQPDGDGPLVLICDDDASVVESFSMVLRTHGYRTTCITDSSRVIEVVESERPDVILLDLLMPGTPGAEVLATLRASERCEVPVVVVSGLGPRADSSIAQSTQGWLVKPVSGDQLVHTVASILHGSTRGSVLLVEDDNGLSTVIETMLEAEGLDVVTAATAAEALVRAHEAPPAIIVLDLLLPDGSGTDIVEELRRGPLADTPLVVYSGATLDNGAKDALQLGETVFLNKARSTPDELKREVLGLLRAVTEGRREVPRPDAHRWSSLESANGASRADLDARSHT